MSTPSTMMVLEPYSCGGRPHFDKPSLYEIEPAYRCPALSRNRPPPPPPVLVLQSSSHAGVWTVQMTVLAISSNVCHLTEAMPVLHQAHTGAKFQTAFFKGAVFLPKNRCDPLASRRAARCKPLTEPPPATAVRRCHTHRHVQGKSAKHSKRLLAIGRACRGATPRAPAAPFSLQQPAPCGRRPPPPGCAAHDPRAGCRQGKDADQLACWL